MTNDDGNGGNGGKKKYHIIPRLRQILPATGELEPAEPHECGEGYCSGDALHHFCEAAVALAEHNVIAHNRPISVETEALSLLCIMCDPTADAARAMVEALARVLVEQGYNGEMLRMGGKLNG